MASGTRTDPIERAFRWVEKDNSTGKVTHYINYSNGNVDEGSVFEYSDNAYYNKGTIVRYNDNIYLCIQANTSANPKAPTDSAYWTKIPTLSDIDEIGFKTGDIKIQTTSTIPSGWLLCNGANISRSTFSNLFAKIGTTYGKGNGSTTFNIPDLRDRYIIGANTKALGTYVAEQLPNITGQLDTRMTIYSINPPSGVFSSSSQTSANSKNWSSNTTVNDTGIYTILFRASSINSVYTNSGKVYPASLALNFIIKI